MVEAKVKDETGEVREYTFIIESAKDLFLRELPSGWVALAT